jgi:hypothetical protein
VVVCFFWGDDDVDDSGGGKRRSEKTVLNTILCVLCASVVRRSERVFRARRKSEEKIDENKAGDIQC